MNEILIKIFQNPLFNITFFGGVVFVVAGFITYKFPPKNINSLYGYRTSSSMENQDKWNFAQNYAAKKMLKLGLVLASTCLLAFITHFDNFTNMLIGLALLILMVVLLFFRVESAIKKNFNEN